MPEDTETLLSLYRTMVTIRKFETLAGEMFAELMGRKTGYCKGKGGSMHIADFSIGILGANGVVAGGFHIAVGAGLSIKLRKTDQVALVFFGDGAANRGTFHE